jgi:spore coat protein CotH
VFEAMGIPAPRNAHARLTVNGEYWGLYELVEPVSKPFLEARVGDKEGNLFDYGWTFAYDFGWLGPEPSRYVPSPFQPQTNEDDPNVGAGLVSFVQAINDTPDPSFVSAMSDRMDVDHFLAHVAVENALAEDDGIVGDFGLNNFYLYEYASKNRFVFIPWDKDNTFRAASWPLYRNLDTNVLTRRLVADPAKRQVYADAAWRAVNGFVNSRWLTPQLETAYQQIRASALADPHKKWTNDQFEGSVAGLRAVIDAREADVAAQR